MRHKHFQVLAVSACWLFATACGGHEQSGNQPNTAGSSASGGDGSSPDAAGGGSSAGTAGGSSKSGTSAGGTQSGAAGPGFDSGLPDDKPLSSLSPDEQQTICDKLKTYYDQSGLLEKQKEFSCRALALVTAFTAMPKTDADLRAACKSAHDACVTMSGSTTDQCTPPGADCTATVGELSACVSDTGDIIAQESNLLPPCDEVTLDGLAGLSAAQPQLPSSCQKYSQKCPQSGQVPGMP